MQQELRNKGVEVDEMVVAAEGKEADNTRLWDQVCIDVKVYCLLQMYSLYCITLLSIACMTTLA